MKLRNQSQSVKKVGFFSAQTFRARSSARISLGVTGFICGKWREGGDDVTTDHAGDEKVRAYHAWD
jgi:hypothetical protein